MNLTLSLGCCFGQFFAWQAGILAVLLGLAAVLAAELNGREPALYVPLGAAALVLAALIPMALRWWPAC